MYIRAVDYVAQDHVQWTVLFIGAVEPSGSCTAELGSVYHHGGHRGSRRGLLACHCSSLEVCTSDLQLPVLTALYRILHPVCVPAELVET
jgi:hypothetical protein